MKNILLTVVIFIGLNINAQESHKNEVYSKIKLLKFNELNVGANIKITPTFDLNVEIYRNTPMVVNIRGYFLKGVFSDNKTGYGGAVGLSKRYGKIRLTPQVIMGEFKSEYGWYTPKGYHYYEKRITNICNFFLGLNLNVDYYFKRNNVYISTGLSKNFGSRNIFEIDTLENYRKDNTNNLRHQFHFDIGYRLILWKN